LKKIVIIPARIQSERLPEKPLRLILNKPMINWTFEAGLQSSADIIQVATDSKKIYDLFSNDNAVMTSSSHLSGTDRVNEAVSKIGLSDHDVIINVQGDEPFISPEDINNLFILISKEEISMATLYSDLKSLDELEDLNKVKILVNDGIASNFFREASLQKNIYIHQGVYAFKYKTLKRFVSWKPSDNEKKYRLEQFRALDNGIKINAIKSVSKIHLGVDTEDDLKKANEIARDDSYK
jgi:3-deoxy-manno-octulosonate cytidylyltransferase (CMP-KDO synthetase)